MPEGTEERLVRIETKLDVLLTQHVDQETRIREIERRVSVAIGGGAVVIVLGELALKYLLK